MQAAYFQVDTALLSARTVARRLREGDGPAFFELIRRNTGYIDDHFPYLTTELHSEESAEIFVRRRLAEWLLQEAYAFGIWHHETADLIGFVQLHEINWDVPRAEVSYFIDHAHAGQGLMTEVMSRVIQFAFKQLRLEKIGLRTLADNYASQRLARKVGFRREGDLRAEVRKNSGALLDIMVLGITREEYGM